MIVLDSSAAVDYLARLEPAPWVEERLREEAAVHAPHLLDIEVASALRSLVLRGVISASRAAVGLEDLVALRVARYPHLPLLGRIWELRRALTAADAAFVALAEALGAVLVTTDARLARAPGVRATIVAP